MTPFERSGSGIDRPSQARAGSPENYDALKREAQRLRAEGAIPDKPTEAERADWAYGNAAIENPHVTREMAEHAARGCTSTKEEP